MLVYASKNKFQFHKGTIRTSQSASIALNRIDFNSIKVRLERLRAVDMALNGIISIP